MLTIFECNSFKYRLFLRLLEIPLKAIAVESRALFAFFVTGQQCLRWQYSDLPLRWLEPFCSSKRFGSCPSSASSGSSLFGRWTARSPPCLLDAAFQDSARLNWCLVLESLPIFETSYYRQVISSTCWVAWSCRAKWCLRFAFHPLYVDFVVWWELDFHQRLELLRVL